MLIRSARDVIQPGGKFFLGDVRCNTVLPHLHVGIQLYQAPEDMTVGELMVRINKSVKFEKELLVDPELFLLLAGRVTWENCLWNPFGFNVELGIIRISAGLGRFEWKTLRRPRNAV